MSVNINGSDGVDSSGKLQSGGDPNDGTAVGAKMLQSGVIQATRSAGASAVYMGFTQGNSTATSRINGDGSALFGTDYKVKIRPFNGANADQFQILDTSDGVTASITGAGAAVFNGVLTGNQRVVVNQAGTKSGASETLLNYAGDGSTVTASIDANGLIYTAAGINFGTATSPVTSKTLDDYEEGTWVPSVRNQASQIVTGGMTTAGTYVKIGNLLYLSATVAITGSGNGYNDGSLTWSSGPTASSIFLVGNVPFAMSESFAEIFTFGTGINASSRRPMFGTQVVTGARQSGTLTITFFHSAGSNTEVGSSMFLHTSDWIGNKFNFACCLKLPA